MIAVLSLLLLVTFFIVSARVATVALVGTGMATDAAAFQARSALMGVGYTTSEAEDVINHPVRRRIILWLMTIGNAGIITGITSLLLGFVNAGSGQTAAGRALMLAVGLVLLLFLTRSALLERGLNQLTKMALGRWTHLETRDLASLLRFGHDYGVIELAAKDDDWLVDRPLADLHLPDEGIVILGVHRRDGRFTGTPTGQTVVHAGDQVIAYGRLDHLRDLDDRHKGVTGDRAHEHAVEETMDELRSLLEDE